jgi:hypothetical protein
MAITFESLGITYVNLIWEGWKKRGQFNFEIKNGTLHLKKHMFRMARLSETPCTYQNNFKICVSSTSTLVPNFKIVSFLIKE